MKDNKYTKVEFKAQIKPIKPLNPEFELVKIYVQGAGKNRNMTYMSKENIEKYSKATLPYCPVVGHIIHGVHKETGEEMSWFGGHDAEIDWDTWEIKDLTVPYGVVCDQEFNWETINEYGEDVEYLTANAILWTGRYGELKDCIYSDDVWFNESMEISVNQYRVYSEDSNYTEIVDWDYSACCILGKADNDSTTDHTDAEMHTEPCFINSRIVPVEFSKSEFTELMNEMKDKLSFCFNQNQHSEDTDSVSNEFDIEKLNGGISTMFENDEKVVDEVVETEPTVDEEVTEVETPDAEAYADADFEAEADAEVNEETTEESTDETVETEEATEETVDDTDDEKNEFSELKAAYDALEAEFAEYKANHSTPNSEVDSLKEYKESKEAEERKNAEAEVFAKYTDIIGETSEYSELVNTASEYSIESLEKECLYIVGKYAIVNNKKNETESIKFSLENNEEEDKDPYGGLMKKYNKMEVK